MNCCPRCLNPNLLNTDRGLFCFPCQELVAEMVPPKPAPRPTALKLPGLDRGRQEVKTDELEKDHVRRIVAGLERNGYRVMQIGQLYAKASGTTKGCPDTFAAPHGVNRWKGLEIKRPGYAPSDVTPEQAALVEQGEIAIVTCLNEALAVLEAEK